MSNLATAKLTLLTLAVLLLSGCTPKTITKSEAFPRMYEEQPRSLLVLPPINESTDATAKEYYATTVEVPLGLNGYYVFPYELTSEILKQEGVYDTELLYNTPLEKFNEYFGADAVLFTRIKKWDVAYMVVGSTLTVSIEAEIKSTKTSQQLWKYTGTVVVDLSGGDTGGGVIGLLLKVAVAAVNTAMADYVVHARQVNGQIIQTMPVGSYHPLHGKDGTAQLFDQTPKAPPVQ